MWAHSDVVSDGSQCTICGCDNGNVLERHHKIPSRYGGRDTGENLVTLCANCHRAIERIYNDGFWSRVSVLDFSENKPQPGKHQENLVWNTEQKEDDVEQTDLTQLASEIVSNGRVSDVEIKRGAIDVDLLEFEFDVDRGDAKLLKKLIKREQKNSQNQKDGSLDIETRNDIICSLYQNGVTQQKISATFSLDQSTVSKICNEHEQKPVGLNSEEVW